MKYWSLKNMNALLWVSASFYTMNSGKSLLLDPKVQEQNDFIGTTAVKKT
jgi:hypothetical protein